MSARGSAFSSNGCAQARSWSCPGVSIKLQGLPKASTSAWTLVVNPPRDLPIACAPFFFAHRRCVDERVRWWHRSSYIRCRDRCQQLENTIENPALRPSAETLMDRFPVAKTLRQITPRTPGPKAVENRFDEQSIVLCRAAHMAFTPGTPPVRSYRLIKPCSAFDSDP